MNDTPTPRTDERKASFALDTIRQLETELAAVTEQLKEAKQQINIRRSNNLRLDRITREQQELIENLKRLSGAREQDFITLREITSKAFEYKEQRGRLAEALGKLCYMHQNHSLTVSSYEAIKQALQSLNQNA